MKNQVSFQPLQKITISAKENLNAFRFVSHLGSLCALGSKSLGTVDKDWLKDKNASVITLGTVPIEVSTTVRIGDNISSGNEGIGKPAEEDEAINARSLDDCTGAGIVKAILVP